MKSFRRFVAAAVVTALTPLVVAGTASATELTNGSGMVTSGSTIAASAEGTTTLHPPIGDIECSGSEVEGTTSNTGGSSETVSSSLSKLTFTGCNAEVVVLAKGSLEVHGLSSNNGTLTSSGAQVTVTFIGFHCIFTTSSTDIGTLTGSATTGATATLDIAATIPRTGGRSGAFCGSTAQWTGAYKFANPDTLNIDGGSGGKTSTSLTTSLSGESKTGEEITVNGGSKAKDTATLNGTNAGKATGTVKYKVYADKECKELVTSAGEVTVKEGKVPASEEKELEAGRVYYWQAEYSGDSSNEASKSTCGKEILTVKAATSLATSLSGEAKTGEEITILEGSKAKDTATLSGTRSSSATGKVKFKAYKDKECKELASEAGEGSLSEGKANSEEKALEAGAVYYWQAEYAGDSLHQGSTSGCGKELLTVKAATSLATSLSGEAKSGEEITVLEGSKAKDTATLSGTRSSSATGKVKFRAYKDKECKELASGAGEGSLSEGKASSEEKALEAAAVYYWQAEYSGDSLHQASTSTCGKEVLTVKASTSISTSLSGEEEVGETITVLEGAKIRDQATLGGADPETATGTISYGVYSDSECKELAKAAGSFEFVESEAPPSKEVELEGGHVYYWQVSYSGDGLHEKSTSPCTEKSTVVGTTAIETSLSGESESGDDIEVEPGVPVFDSATLEGPGIATATGAIEYFVYEDDECEELLEAAGTGSVKAGEPDDSEEVELAAGDYYWQAIYNGDEAHEEAISACDEVVQVAPGTTLTTSLEGLIPGAEEVVTGAKIEVPEGTWVRDTSVLTGENAETATGYIGYAVYADPECKEFVANLSGGNFGEEEAEAEEEPEEEESEGLPTSNYVRLAAGTYYWRAAYTGDENNKSSESNCGSEELVVEDSSLTTMLSGGGHSSANLAVEEGVSVTDLATLHLASPKSATGTIEYDVYYDEACEELAEGGGEFSLEGEGKVPSSLALTLPAGTYYWQATYSGDLTHPELTEECGSESLVIAGETSLSTLLSEGGESKAEIKVLEGEPVTDTATLSGPNFESATGTIEYNVYTDEKCEKFFIHAGSGDVEGKEIDSSSEVELPAGTYYWQAIYEGDLNNQEAISPCGSEVETVGLAAVTTSLSGGDRSGPEIEVEEEVPVKDTATLNIENPSTATGTIEYFVYEDGECKEPVEVEAGEVAVKGKEIKSSKELELSEGTYYWQAHYSGDGSHPEATSVCGAEVLQVADGPPPWIVSVGDSYISGEGGRWAGNIHWDSLPLAGTLIDALGRHAYENPENDEGDGEEVPRCHRSKSAEVFIRYANGKPVASKNFACSGAEAISTGFKARGLLGPKLFKPGLDEKFKLKGEKLTSDIHCPLPACKGQVLKLKEFAQERFDNQEEIKMVVVSVGGNDFGFADFVEACAKDFINLIPPRKFCKDEAKWKNQFENLGKLNKMKARIKAAIERVAAATAIRFPAATILVQDYPSPIPKAADLRYPEALARETEGRCPIRNADADWANNVALAKIDETVRNAELAAKANFPVIKFMELKEAFNGRRLCEKNLQLVGLGKNPLKLGWRQENASTWSEWINQIRLLTTANEAMGNAFYVQEDLHPNYWGQLGLRNCLRKAYSLAVLPDETTCKVVTGPGAGLEPLPAGVTKAQKKTWMEEPKMTFP